MIKFSVKNPSQYVTSQMKFSLREDSDQRLNLPDLISHCPHEEALGPSESLLSHTCVCYVAAVLFGA